MTESDSSLGAFCPFPPVRIKGVPEGILSGINFAVKDVFDVAGHVTGCGNPTWLATHAAATDTAPIIQMLLDSGASLTGKTITDELAFSLIGDNCHYGAPSNPLAPDRVVGGSSSGSAAAVAGGLVDTALGTDTAGSIRLPASFCGLFGFRPSHGRLPLAGVMPLSPRFDTVGWFARDAAMLRRIGDVLLRVEGKTGADDANGMRPRGVLLVEDAFAITDSQVNAALGPAIDAVTAALGSPRDIMITRYGLEDWMRHFSILQGGEIWRTHGAWITAHRPVFAPDVAQRFAWTATIRPEEIEAADAAVRLICARLEQLLADRDLLCLPTAPGIAPLRRAERKELDSFRARALCLSSIAGLGGLPQVTLPLAELDGCPLGLSLIARRGGDEMLLAACERAAKAAW